MTDELQRLAAEGARFTLCHPKAKNPIGNGWQRTPYSLGAALAHLSRGGNVGLLCGELSGWLIALDFDKRAAEFGSAYAHLCGWSVRRDNAPDRAKYLMRCINARNQKDHAAGLEVLAFGNAIVAGVHETGARVVMTLQGDVPELTIEALGALFASWTGKPYGRAAKAGPRLKTFAPPNAAPMGAALTVRLLLDNIARWRADDYNEWVRIGHAVKNECGAGGFDLWDGWSRTSAKYDAAESRAKWEGLSPNGGVTIRTLRYLAAEDSGFRLDGN